MALLNQVRPSSPETGAAGGRVVTLPIRGMTCASCVSRVEQAIRAVPGVLDASVNGANERASVTLAPEVSPALLIEAVERAGYGVGTETFYLSVSGMTCASCVGRVERALKRVGGVTGAEVNVATERARVTAPAGAVTRARSLARLTTASATPSTRFSARSTRPTQEAQVMPETDR